MQQKIETKNTKAVFYLGDCLVEMDKIADKSVDAIICDLPYGVTAMQWDIIIPIDKLWMQYERIIKPNGAIVLFCQQPTIYINVDYFKYSKV